MNFKLPFPELYPVILEAITPSTKVYLVGGCVRDLLLGRDPQDIDLALSAEVKKVSRTIANYFDGAVFSLDDERETMRVIIASENRNWKLDIALLRGGSLSKDLQTRDFTINAMALEILPKGKSRLVDIVGGQNDLESCLVRPCNENSIVDDPIRILRAARLALSLNFEFSVDVESQMLKAADLLEQVSGERQRDELFKLLELDHSTQAFSHYQKLDIYEILFPRFSTESLDVLECLDDILSQQNREDIHNYLRISLVESRTIKALIKFSVLTKEDIGLVCDEYALSNREKVFLERIQLGVSKLDSDNLLAIQANPGEIYRYFRLTDDAGVGACFVYLANKKDTLDPSDLSELVRSYFEEYDRYIGIKPLLDGNDLIRHFHLQPGPLFKSLLEALKEAQVVGIVSSREDAEQFIAAQLK